jgi:hypothetical protein
MDKSAILGLLAKARQRAEQSNLDITAQNKVITALEMRGIDATMAKAILVRIITRQANDLAEMERLLDEMDVSRQNEAWKP